MPFPGTCPTERLDTSALARYTAAYHLPETIHRIGKNSIGEKETLLCNPPARRALPICYRSFILLRNVYEVGGVNPCSLRNQVSKSGSGNRASSRLVLCHGPVLWLIASSESSDIDGALKAAALAGRLLRLARARLEGCAALPSTAASTLPNLVCGGASEHSMALTKVPGGTGG